MGKDSLIGFQWYKGNPSFWKNLVPHGELVGETDLLSGTYMTGARCQKCRKIVLDYYADVKLTSTTRWIGVAAFLSDL